MKYIYSPQKGKPDHCLLAQVFDEHGEAVADIRSTELEEEATQTAKLFSKAPEMVEVLKRVMSGKKYGDIEYIRETGKIIQSLLKELES